MTAFRVVVRTASARLSYTAIAAAVDQFGVCSVTAIKEKKQ